MHNSDHHRIARLLLAVGAIVLISSGLLADTIVLKNGRRIRAGAVSEEGDKVFYEAEGGRISIPKSLVDRVEKDDSEQPQPRSPRANPASEVFAKALSIQISMPRKDTEGVIRDGLVDEERLRTLGLLAGQGDLERQTAVNAYVTAAVFESRQQRPAQASHWAEEALRLSVQDANALLLAAQFDIMRQQYKEALSHLQLAQSLRPDSPDVLTLLGYAYYFLEGPEKANRYWKQSHAARPDEKLADLIRQTDKEEQLEGGFQQSASSHFVLNREGSQISESFSHEILETLEQQYRDLESALDFAPLEPITITLYPAQEFADITRVPGWAGALNDGKIRVPVQGLSSVTAALVRVLKHEMVHSFVFRQTQGHCPTWFNEGLAQVESGEAPAVPRSILASLYTESRGIPLSQLEGSFMALNSTLAGIAYAESQAAVAMVGDRYGAYQLPEILRALAAGKNMAEALRAVLRMDYSDLESELGAYLTRPQGR